MTAETINANLKVVKLGTQCFAVPGGYIKPTGYALFNPELGFFAFVGDGDGPYTPVGGKKALQSILDGGGFLNFDTAVWLTPFKHTYGGK
jgi:hypothetical protein